MRRAFCRGGVVALFWVALSASPAFAHNGTGAAFKGRAGPYTVYAYDGYTLPNDALQYRLVLLDTASGEPDDNLRVAISASKPGTARVATTANVYANVVFYALANPYPANWLVDLRLDGHLGHGEVTFHMHGYPGYTPAATTTTAAASPVTHKSDGVPVAAIAAASAVGVIVAGAAAVLWRRRRAAHLP